MLKLLTNDNNKKTTQESTYIKENISEINDTDELLEGIFPIDFKTTDQYQQKDRSILAKYKKCTYKTGSFRRESNINFNLLPCKYRIGIVLTPQSYALN